MGSQPAALSLHGVSKSFDGQPALECATFSVRWGEVHALLGENGAGKSTLMNIVCGLYTADEGVIRLNGKVAVIHGPRDATRRGIGMVHQHFKLVAPFTVTENVLLACGAKLGLRTQGEAERATTRAASQLGFSVDPEARVEALSVAERQRVEIIKLVLLGADILILDEPTAVLTDNEAESVLRLLRELASQGKAAVLITHRLREVTGYTDRVTIMRNGQTVLDDAEAASLDATELARFMVGDTSAYEEPGPSPGGAGPPASNLSDNQLDDSAVTGPVRLEVSGFSVDRADRRQAVRNVSFQVRAGEILGVAGVGGNGQTELTEAIFGLTESSRGTISIDGQLLRTSSVRERRARGLRLVPADRFAYALLAELKAYENLALADVPSDRYGPWWWLRRGAMRRSAAEVFAKRQIVGGKPVTTTRLLSGGNAQKLLLARELNDQTAVLVAHSPTRGLDVRAYHAVHQSILSGVKRGAACLLISEDLDEVLQLSARIAVMSRGHLHGPFPKATIDRAAIGKLMAGDV